MIHSDAAAPSHSRLSKLHFCERFYFYRYIRGLESPQQFAPAYMGKCLHEGLEAWHRTGNVEASQTTLMESWGSQRFHGDWDWVTAGHASLVLRSYMESKHTQDWTVVRLRRSDLDASRLIETDVKEDPDGFLMMAEASFIVDVPGLGLINIRPDLLLKTPTGLRVTDHKTTTSYLGSNIYNTTKYSHQLRLYALGMGALLKEPVGEGACNAIYAGKKASDASFKGTKFESYVFDYAPADFAETRAWYKAGVERMQAMQEHFTLQDELNAPQNPGSHCGYCDFSKLCAAPAALRPGLIRMTYKEKAA